ncbi:Sal-like protein 4 [Heterocephalus glaber]|uniref:Sal-like protein 4 n=1 Tax=Heterocephalus glaber TaxID=10181 RepID=G5BQQ0_HETGA|nr:Sal-like protein 4 [Heterocephalus glaber]
MSMKMQHLYPVCQKFTSAVMLMPYIHTDMGGQIPNTPLLENPCYFMGPEPMMVNENCSAGNNQGYDSQSPDTMETMSFQALPLANSQAECTKSRSPSNTGIKAESSKASHTELGGQSRVPSMFIQAQPTYVKVEVPGTSVEPSTMSAGVTPLLAAQPL